tara:strand:- start:115 stop:1329 length:1215 start_codon:yes stop_codon:yes gene_type:complete
MRWSTFSLGSVLSKTEIWTGEQVDVTKTLSTSTSASARHPHLVPGTGNPLKGKYIIGDLSATQLRESTLRSAIRSIERVLNLSSAAMADIAKGDYTSLVVRLKQLCPNNIWHKHGDMGDRLKSDNFKAGRDKGMKPPVVGASVDDVAVALQAAVLGTIGANLDDSTVTKATSSSRINDAVAELAGVTSEMSDFQRKSISDAFEQTAPKFKTSRAALKKYLKNTDESKTEAAESAYIEALSGDFKREWRSISSTAKDIAAKIGIDADGAEELFLDEAMQNGPMSDKVRQMVQNMRLPAFQRVLGKWWLGCSIDLPTIVGLDESGILTPFGAYLFRPFQSFSMGSGICMKAGQETGFTAVGNSDFQLGDNVTNKTHLGHFTFYFEPVVSLILMLLYEKTDMIFMSF